MCEMPTDQKLLRDMTLYVVTWEWDYVPSLWKFQLMDRIHKYGPLGVGF